MSHPRPTRQAKPFLKWAGGKTQLLAAFHDFYPAQLKEGKLDTYIEPFIGGGAVFFDVAGRLPIKRAILCDVNPEVVCVYHIVRNKAGRLIQTLQAMETRFKKVTPEKRKEMFYRVRTDYNQDRASINYRRYDDKLIKRAAQILFLNRTCYNGLFRFNRRGEFNAPFGRYKNPTICDADNLQRASETLKMARIRCCDFEAIGGEAAGTSFVYYDPPYRPISSTSSFTSYSSQEFNDDAQQRLARLYRALDKKGVKQMLSNSDPKNVDPRDDFFDNLYRGYHIHRIKATRMINSKAARRGKINELIVTNYSVPG